MPISLTFMQGKIKAWIKIAEPTLIPVLIKGGSFLFSFPPFKTHIPCDQFHISMFTLGRSIGEKHHALIKAWANITCYNVATYTAKLYNHTIPNKESQVID